MPDVDEETVAQTAAKQAEVAYLVATARTSAGLTRTELALRAGVGASELEDIEDGTVCPSAAVFLRLIDAAGCSVNLTPERRVRHADGLDRREELETLLELVRHFPPPPVEPLRYPNLKDLVAQASADRVRESD